MQPSLHGSGVVSLSYPTNSVHKMRLRISEIDYYDGPNPPAAVDTR